MCLPDFTEFKQIKKENSIIGYRHWINNNNSLELKSINQNYIWTPKIVSHKVLNQNSGIYSYKDCNYSYNNYNNYYSYYNNCYYSNYNNCYYIGGIIKQYGKVAIHQSGYRSQYAIIDKLFTIRESDAKGPKIFLDWIVRFNEHINEIAQYYKCSTTIHLQDFLKVKLND
jgi:hypothetical protein